MDKATLMHMAERPRERDRDAQELRYVQGSAEQSVDRRTAGILKHQRHAAVDVRQRDWSRRPVRVKFSFERIFVFKPLDATKRRFFGGNKQDRRQAVAGAPVEGDVSLPQGREYVAQELVHEGLLPGGLLSTLIRLRLLSSVNPKQTLKRDRITIGAILWLDDDENRAGLLLIKPRCFVEEKCADEVIDKSTYFR
jgi:hypothetical protein